MKFRLLLLLLLFLGITAVVISQDEESDGTCPAIVETALDSADLYCSDTARNQVCYGHVALEAEPQSGITEFVFESVGDIEDVTEIETLRLKPLDEETGEWGVALMRLQANLPDTLPGQNVTFILFGDVEITNAVSDEDIEGGEMTPMQAFYLKTGVSDAQCEEAPESGLLVQTPEGVGEVSFVVNEVEVAVGSTVLFQAEPEGEMIVNTLEGSAVLNIENEQHPVIAGTRLRIRLDRNLRPLGTPPDPEAYDQDRFRRLPLHILERQIEVREPLTRSQILRLRERIRNGQPPCGEDPFPSCDRLPAAAGGTPCTMPSRDGRLPNRIERPLCEAVQNLREVQQQSTAEVPSADCIDRPGLRQRCVTPVAPDMPVELNATEEVPDSRLPAGCEPGICLRDPAEACRCVLCGIQCPEGAADTNTNPVMDNNLISTVPPPGPAQPGIMLLPPAEPTRPVIRDLLPTLQPPLTGR